MPANANDVCCLYWIRDEICVDPFVDGYIGLTKNIQSSWSNHRRSGEFPPAATIVILHQGTRIECAKREKDYRPRSDMGWNRSNGGGRWRKAPNPLDSPDAHDAAARRAAQRAGRPIEPKPERDTTPALIAKIKYWADLRANRPEYLRGMAPKFIDSLAFDSDEDWKKAVRRYRKFTKERKAEIDARYEAESKSEAESKIVRCSFCSVAASDDLIVIRDDLLWRSICENCIGRFAAIVAKRKAKGKTRR